jgi:peptide/nickel transport system permease protein
MWAYVVRRILAFVPTIFVAITLIFILTRMVPGNPVWSLVGYQGVSDERVKEVSHDMGLDRPVLVQYLAWLPKVLRGDFGNSVFFNRPVIAIIAERFPVTLSLAGLAMLLTLVTALPLGILAATRQNSSLDQASMVFSTLGVSIPNFWLGFLLMLLFAVILRWFPAAGYRPASMGIVPWLSRLVLPVLTLSMSQIALLVRQTRSSMLDVLGEEYIVTARAKGLSEAKVIYKHALRNAFVLIITVIGLTFALSLGGSVLVETVFAIPGIGQLITTAAIRRDYPVIEGGIAFLTALSLVANLLVDLSYAIINPRVSYE